MTIMVMNDEELKLESIFLLNHFPRNDSDYRPFHVFIYDEY